MTVAGKTLAITEAAKARIAGLTPATAYTASVVAIDGAGNASSPTTTSSFTTRAEDRGRAP